MIHEKHLPMNVWEKASNMAIYVYKIIPHKIFGNKKPEEVFIGKKLEVSHFRIFGCPMFIHVPKEKIMKYEPLGKKGTFIGYCETFKAYIIYIPEKRQIETRRDVTFDEDESFRRSREYHIYEDQIEKEAPKYAFMVHSTPEVILMDVSGAHLFQLVHFGSFPFWQYLFS
jgi:hypothetical protein